MVENLYRIRFRRADFEVDIQGDKAWVEKKFKELTTMETAIVNVGKPKTKGLPDTLGEFLDLKGNPSRHTDVVAVFAFWVFKVEKMQSFNVKDIVSCYDKTRKSKPKNPNMIINQNVSTFLFAEAPDKKDGYKAWIITRKGEDHVNGMK